MIKSFKQQKDISLGLKKYLKLSDPNSSPTSCQQHQKLDKLLATGVEWIHHTLMEDKKGKIQVIYTWPRSRLPSDFASTLENTRSQRKEKCLPRSNYFESRIQFPYVRSILLRINKESSLMTVHLMRDIDLFSAFANFEVNYLNSIFSIKNVQEKVIISKNK